ncbi:caspase family protein [Yoonia sp. R2331]|uniref:caspase family protein n=1 Tax=Yoonia sp. R2331 TaxID=3237238 RepID=UPI0034E5EA4B
MKALVTAAALCCAALPAWAEKTYGLVIGIDDYANVPDLQGAVNDARDIADALAGIGAEVTLLLDQDATRAAIFAAWEATAAKVQPGDRLVVSYAGHGSYEPEYIIGSEADGRDENFLLSGFSFQGAGAAERIRDDEIAALIALTPQAEVVFLADSCHSGTVSRNVTPVLGYRYVIGGKLSDDPLPPPPPRTSPSEGKDDVALFLAAVDDANKVPEFLIDGAPRGALSYSFARGLRGAADTDENGAVTKDELASYVRRSVREVSQGLQAPQISPRGDEERVLFALDGAPTPVMIEVSPFEKTLAGLPPLAVAQNGGNFGATVLAGIDGVQLVEDPLAAGAFADFSAGVLRSTVGDVLASFDESSAAAGLEQAVNKMRVTQAIADAGPAGRLEVRFAEGDRSYTSRDRVTVQIRGRSTPYITLVAVASDGSVSLLYPYQGDGINDPQAVIPADPLNLVLQVTPPFGADHIIAIETNGDGADLRAVLSHLDSQSSRTPKLWEVLRTAVLKMDTQPRIALFPFYTRP